MTGVLLLPGSVIPGLTRDPSLRTSEITNIG